MTTREDVKDKNKRGTYAFSGYCDPARTAKSVHVTAKSPPSAIEPMAASIKGEAEPYGSRSTTSTRAEGVRRAYISELACQLFLHDESISLSRLSIARLAGMPKCPRLSPACGHLGFDTNSRQQHDHEHLGDMKRCTRTKHPLR